MSCGAATLPAVGGVEGMAVPRAAEGPVIGTCQRVAFWGLLMPLGVVDRGQYQ